MDIVFDIGNVICEWDPHRLVDKLFSNEIERIEAIEYIIKHEDWLMLDKGVLSLEDAISRANDRCFLGVEKIRKVFEETPKSLIPFQETVNLIMDLSEKGYQLYILSNMHKHTFEYLSTAMDIWRYFSGIVISCYVKAIKPEPKIFEYLIKTYHLIPENTVFIDDLRDNIESAKTFGLNTIHVQSPSQVKKELYRIIGI